MQGSWRYWVKISYQITLDFRGVWTNVGLNSPYFWNLYAARMARVPSEIDLEINIDYNIIGNELTFKDKKPYPY